MNLATYILIFATLIACNSDKNSESNERSAHYIETQLPFTDLFYYCVKDNQWIRDSKNILTVHETFKPSFYKKLLNDNVLDEEPFVNGDLYYSISLRQKIDSLALSYPNHHKASKFYKEFWERRIKEGNDSTVNLVLTEIQQMIDGEEVPTREEYVNATLQKLINIWIDYEAMSRDKALDHLNFFKSMGMHQSAYNLLYENFLYDGFEINRDSIVKLLKKEKAEKNTFKNRSVFIVDNTK